jgi:hypothetical protein
MTVIDDMITSQAIIVDTSEMSTGLSDIKDALLVLWTHPAFHAQIFSKVTVLNPLTIKLEAGAMRGDVGSGLIDHIQKMTMAAIAMADMKVCAQRS